MTGSIPLRYIDADDPPSMKEWAEALIDIDNLKKGFLYVAWLLSVKPSFLLMDVLSLTKIMLCD